MRNIKRKSKVFKVDEESLRNLKANEKRKALSILGSQKSIKSSDGEGTTLLKNMKKNYYNFKGSVYEEIGEENGKVKLYSKDKKDTLYFSRD